MFYNIGLSLIEMKKLNWVLTSILKSTKTDNGKTNTTNENIVVWVGLHHDHVAGMWEQSHEDGGLGLLRNFDLFFQKAWYLCP